MMVPLEAFTTWATRASPLHRHAPDMTGTAVPGRFMGTVAFACVTRKTIIYGNLRFGSHSGRGVRGQQSRSVIANLEVFYYLGDACVAPTRIGPYRPVGPTGAFHGGRCIRLRDQEGDHLRKSAVRYFHRVPGIRGQQS